MKSSPEEILEDSKQLYENKNEDYGDSWKLTGKILSLIIEQSDNEVLEIPADSEYFVALGLYTRRLDKLVRSFNNTFLQDDTQVDESVEETVKDQVPYAAMHAALASEMESVTVEDEPKDVEVEPDNWERCPECEKLAADRTKVLQPEIQYEYYCECGHAWWE